MHRFEESEENQYGEKYRGMRDDSSKVATTASAKAGKPKKIYQIKFPNDNRKNLEHENVNKSKERSDDSQKTHPAVNSINVQHEYENYSGRCDTSGVKNCVRENKTSSLYIEVMQPRASEKSKRQISPELIQSQMSNVQQSSEKLVELQSSPSDGYHSSPSTPPSVSIKLSKNANIDPNNNNLLMKVEQDEMKGKLRIKY
jgi:hypothetical protein